MAADGEFLEGVQPEGLETELFALGMAGRYWAARDDPQGPQPYLAALLNEAASLHSLGQAMQAQGEGAEGMLLDAFAWLEAQVDTYTNPAVQWQENVEQDHLREFTEAYVTHLLEG